MDQFFQGIYPTISEIYFLFTGGGQWNRLEGVNSRIADTVKVNPFLLLFLVSLIPRLFEAFQAVRRFVEDYITQRFYVSMEITKKEHQVYSRIMEYVTEKQMGDIHKKLRRVQCVAKVDQANPLAAQNYGGSVEKPPHPELSMRPKSGETVDIVYKGYKMQVTNREADFSEVLRNSFTGYNSGLFSARQDAIEIRMRGSDLLLLKSLVQEWIDYIYDRDINKLTIYQCVRNHGHYDWEPVAVRELRKFESVVLRKGLKEEILDDIQKFRAEKRKYQLRGIPYRRAIILHGPPGTGKTSFIQSLAEKLKMNLAYISLAARMDDEEFLKMLSKVPDDTFIVIEDFDRSKVIKNANADNSNGPGLTEAGLLNALDGVNTPDGTLIFMTCNDLSKVDQAVRRPGRIDQIYHISYADEYQMEEMFWRFFGTESTITDPEERYKYPELCKVAKAFTRHISSSATNVTTALLQKLLMEFEKEELVLQRTAREKELCNGGLNKAPSSKAKVDESIDIKKLMDGNYIRQLLEKVTKIADTVESLAVQENGDHENKNVKVNGSI